MSDSGIQLPIKAEAIAFDLDGTLLDYDGRLSESVARAVRLITRGGIKVFLVTGRLQGAAEAHWKELGLDTPIASCNGASVGFPGEKPFLSIRLSENARDTVTRIARENRFYVQYYIDNHVYSLSDGPEREWYSRVFCPVEKLAEPEDLRELRLPTKMICITPENEQRRAWKLFAEALGPEAAITRSNERFTEILSPKADKGVGLRALSDWSGLALDRFIAVGDALNDLPMLRAAGFSISFKSGDPSLAEHVDMLLPPLWEDGMEILAKCILGMTNSGRFFTRRTERFFKK